MLLIRPLDDILSSQAKVGVLRVLSQSPIGLTGREVARRAGIATGHISRVLRELSASYVIFERYAGRSKLYSYDDRSPLSRQLKQLFEQEERRFRDVIGKLAKETPDLQSIIVFGSEARGEAAATSDTDVLVVLDKLNAKLRKNLRRRCMDLVESQQIRLSCHLADLPQVRQWQRQQHPFWTNVVRDGRLVWGKDLRRNHGDLAGIPSASPVVLGSG